MIKELRSLIETRRTDDFLNGSGAKDGPVPTFGLWRKTPGPKKESVFLPGQNQMQAGAPSPASLWMDGWMDGCMHACMLHIYTPTNVNTCIYIYIYTHICTYICTHTFTYVYIYMYNMYIYIDV